MGESSGRNGRLARPYRSRDSTSGRIQHPTFRADWTARQSARGAAPLWRSQPFQKKTLVIQLPCATHTSKRGDGINLLAAAGGTVSFIRELSSKGGREYFLEPAMLTARDRGFRARSRIETALARDAQLRQRDDDYRTRDERVARLTPRDRETLELILAGAANKSIAAKLFISERTVEMRRAAIMRKLQFGSLAELLELAITHRLMGEIADALLDARLR